ncbi:glucose cotransporter 4-like [Octopus vulgaris]|uniref:Glucose cotransporter 4-like n=1 Tax=Octopus vulgaris TaxID=6645 RepID=A0AA36AKW7_OCTVU|nr:glucose cotransporter 4-like [Octopus vulgaris]
MAEVFANTLLSITDIVIVAVYFAIVLFVGLWSSRKNRSSTRGYFMAGRNMSWMPVGASLFASNIGSIHFIGLAGSGAAAGIAVGVFEINAMFVLLLMGYIFLPVYISAGIYTMPEYLKLRFGGRRIQLCMAILSLIVYVFTKISYQYYGYLLDGQIGFIKVGGYSAMVEKYPQAIPNTTLMDNTTKCGYPREDYMHLFHSYDADDIPGPGIIGLTINSIWYWCSDQVLVQRALAAKSYDHSKAATVFCGYLKILPLFLLIFPGMISRILYKDTVGCADPEVCMSVCGSETGCTNVAYTSLILDLLPEGLRGLMLASMVSALITSLTSIFNSSSTIFALDIWSFFRKKVSDIEMIIVGRIFILFLVVISVLWIPIIQISQGGDLFVYIQVISSFTQPPICAIFLLALFWGRLNEKGAFYALVFGMLVGLIRFIVEYYHLVPPCFKNLPDPRPDVVKNFHFLYFSIFGFAFTLFFAVVISLLTEPIDPRCLVRLTWWTRHSKEPRMNIDETTSSSASTINGEDEKNENDYSNPLRKMSPKSNIDVDHPNEKDFDDINSAGEDAGNYKTRVYSMDIVTAITPVPCWKKFIYRMCCFQEQSATQPKQMTTDFVEERSIEENPKWRLTTSVLSVGLLIIACFLMIYFA